MRQDLVEPDYISVVKIKKEEKEKKELKNKNFVFIIIQSKHNEYDSNSGAFECFIWHIKFIDKL